MIVENKCEQQKIKTVRSDNDKKYCNHNFGDYLAQHEMMESCNPVNGLGKQGTKRWKKCAPDKVKLI